LVTSFGLQTADRQTALLYFYCKKK